MENTTITYSASSISDSLIEASKDFVIKLLVDEDGEATMRRIRLFRIFDTTGKICFEKLIRLTNSKVKYSSRMQDIRLSYLDVDDDCVIVDSAEDLIDAIDQFADQRVLRLFVGEVTPAMRQAYYQMQSSSTIAAAPRAALDTAEHTINDNNNNGNTSNGRGDVEHETLERQIEQILEKRFRMLEQQRRGKENGSNSGTPRNNMSPTPQSSPSIRQQQQPYGNRGWDDYDEDMIGDVLQDDFVVPKENIYQPTSPPPHAPFLQYGGGGGGGGNNSSPSASVDRLRSRSPQLPPKPHNNNKQQQRQRSLSMDLAHINTASSTPPQFMEQEYDLTARTAMRQRQGSFRGQQYSAAMIGGTAAAADLTPRRRSSTSSMSMRNAAQARGVIDPTAEMEVFRNMMMSSVRSPGNNSPGPTTTIPHRTGGGVPLQPPYPADLYHNEEYQEEYDSEESESRNNPNDMAIMGDDDQFQEWDANTIDSDAELSLLLSDTDFRGGDAAAAVDHRDDTSLTKAIPGRENNTLLLPTRQHLYHHHEEREEPPSPLRDPATLSQPQQMRDSPSPTPPSTRLPPKPPSPSPKSNSTNNPTASPRVPPSTPNNNNNNSNNKAGTADSKFNNIPRPTPPRKNKLIGMLYNNE